MGPFRLTNDGRRVEGTFGKDFDRILWWQYWKISSVGHKETQEEPRSGSRASFVSTMKFTVLYIY